MAFTDERIKHEIESFNQGVVERNPAEYEFHQAVREFTESVMPFAMENEKYTSDELEEFCQELTTMKSLQKSFYLLIGQIS